MRRFQGFSLLELLVVLMILGIVSGYGLSFLPSLFNKNQHEVIADEIKQAIHFAKIEALTRDRVLTLSPISEDADWSTGMRLFEDNQMHHDTPKSMVVREWRWRRGSIKVTWQGFESKDYLRFTPDLLSRSANGCFLIQDGRNQQIKLVVNRLARVRQEIV